MSYEQCGGSLRLFLKRCLGWMDRLLVVSRRLPVSYTCLSPVWVAVTAQGKAIGARTLPGMSTLKNSFRLLWYRKQIQGWSVSMNLARDAGHGWLWGRFQSLCGTCLAHSDGWVPACLSGPVCTATLGNGELPFFRACKLPQWSLNSVKDLKGKNHVIRKMLSGKKRKWTSLLLKKSSLYYIYTYIICRNICENI